MTKAQEPAGPGSYPGIVIPSCKCQLTVFHETWSGMTLGKRRALTRHTAR
jgi:hypothetical protein